MRLHPALALIIVATVPSVARAGRVWVVFDQGQRTCRQHIEDELACMVYATNFNANAVTFPDDGAGRPGESIVIAGPSIPWDQSVCPLTNCVIGDRATSLSHYQCLEDHLHLPLRDD